MCLEYIVTTIAAGSMAFVFGSYVAANVVAHLAPLQAILAQAILAR